MTELKKKIRRCMRRLGYHDDSVIHIIEIMERRKRPLVSGGGKAVRKISERHDHANFP